jgi:hypothetical protein
MVTLFMPFSTYDALGYRMESAIALLLASVATKFTVTEHLPKVSVLTLCESHMNMCFVGILLNIFTSIVLYIIEKYASPDSLSESMSDDKRFLHRKHYYGGQPCALGTMISAHIITALTLLLFIVWHVYVTQLVSKYKNRRDAWRTLALPASLELCGRPLPSILTQFNGEDTAIAKARDHLLSKFGNHLRHRSSSGRMSSPPVLSSSHSGDAEEKHDTCSTKKTLKHKHSGSMYNVAQKDLIKEHSMNASL